MNAVGPLLMFPWLKNVAPDQLGFTNSKEARIGVTKLINETLDEHMKTFDPDNIRDFTDAYIKELTDHKDDTFSSFNAKRGRDNFIVVMTNLFVGGSETTANSLNYVLWYLCKV